MIQVQFLISHNPSEGLKKKKKKSSRCIMAATTSAIFLSPSPPSFTFKLKLVAVRPLSPRPTPSLHFPPYPLPRPPLSFSPSSTTTRFQGPSLPACSPPRILRPRPRLWTASVASSAAADDVVVVPPDAAASPVADSSSQQLLSAPDGGVSNVISVLLFVAFVGLSILTIGVIYIAVTDFLQKRESKKFEEEEAAKKKKGGKKRKVKARAGPKGFGQKPTEEEEAFDD